MNAFRGVKKDIALVIGFVTIAVVVMLVAAWGFNLMAPQYGHYERDIQRNAEGEEEVQLLELAENFSYGEVFEVDRYVGGGDELWANYIDFQVVEHYNREYERLRDGEARHDVTFIYKAKVVNTEELKITCTSARDIYSRERIIFEANGSQGMLGIESREGEDMAAFFNGTDFVVYDSITDLQLNFQDVHLVRFYLEYSDTWDLVGAYYVEIEQVMVFDGEGQPVFIYVSCIQLVS
ncbi:MAG: hypothetical protein JSW28_03420 [Thermoplasmata archaeon]|nr:MAG: hypothetical protein JSW28_03420 [Thermoplasmata archaeon]